MLQSSLVEALSGSPDLIGVLPSSGARTDTRIHLTIKNFEAQFDQGEKAAPIAIVRYTATLADASDRALLNTFVAHKSVRADAASVSEIVRALETANNQAMDDIVAWLETIAASGKLG
jgi:cholesterol transport system auxiliary component